MEEMANQFWTTPYSDDITETKQQRALLLHYAGQAVDEIFDTLPDTGVDKDYKTAVDVLNAYFIPQVNSTFEEYNFRQAKQQHGENIDAFHTRLKADFQSSHEAPRSSLRVMHEHFHPITMLNS
jgi:hypothetical protein